MNFFRRAAPSPKQLARVMKIVVTVFFSAVIAIPTASVPAQPQPFSLAISAVHERVRWGSQVELKLTLTNNSDGEITIVDIDRWCDYSLEVRDSQGQAVPETAYKRELNCTPWPPVAARRIIRTLKPHESFDDLMYVSQAYEVNHRGDYFIRAMREIPRELGKGTV
jgi:hypothetical protein